MMLLIRRLLLFGLAPITALGVVYFVLTVFVLHSSPPNLCDERDVYAPEPGVDVDLAKSPSISSGDSVWC